MSKLSRIYPKFTLVRTLKRQLFNYHYFFDKLVDVSDPEYTKNLE